MVFVPLVSEYREIMIILEYIIIVMSFQIALFFLGKYFQNIRHQKASRVELDWALFFLGFGFMFSFYQFSDFYFYNRNFFLFLSYLSIAITQILFAFHSEKIDIIKTKPVLTIISFFICFGLIISYFIDPHYPQFIALPTILLFMFIVFYYISKIVRNLTGKYKTYTIGLIGGIILLFIGNLGTTNTSINIFGEIIRTFADVIMIIGMVHIAIFFNVIPSLSEIEWYDKLKGIMVINRAGICLYSEDFKEKKKLD